MCIFIQLKSHKPMEFFGNKKWSRKSGTKFDRLVLPYETLVLSVQREF